MVRWSAEELDFSAFASSTASFPDCVPDGLPPFHIPNELRAEVQYGVSWTSSLLGLPSAAPSFFVLMIRRCGELGAPCDMSCLLRSPGRSPDLPQYSATVVFYPSLGSIVGRLVHVSMPLSL